MSFDPNDPRITAYVFGELPEAERADFETELQESDDLCRAVDETRRTLETLAGELKVEPEVGLSDQQRETLSQEIEKTHSAKPDADAVTPGRRRSVGRLVAIVAVAASLLLVCGLGYTFIITRTHDRVAASANSAEVYSIQGTLSMDAAPATEAADGAAAPVSIDLSARRADDRAPSEPAADPVQFSVHPRAPARPEQPTETYMYDTRLPREARGQAKEYYEKSQVAVRTGYGSPSTRSDANHLMPNPHYVKDDVDYGGHPGKPGDLGVDHGEGPGRGGDKYSHIVENPFKEAKNEPLSTFSIDVDTASYAKVRMYLMQHGRMPRPDSVRIEELVNYFTYSYEPPTDDVPFAAAVEVADCPWQPEHRLVRVGIKGQEIDNEQRPASNLVFLLDVSGSMNKPNKLPLLKCGMKMLVDQLGENDRVAIAVYASAAGLVLDSTTGDDKQVIIDALDRLHAGGSTNGGQGIHLAYQTALDNFIKGGVNRVILCTDGDFNVGVTGTDELVQVAEENAKTGVFLSVLGFGMGNHNDSMLEQISNKGNGNYAFIDTDSEARKVLVEQMSGTLVTIAKDVKIQIDFNPVEVASYRLIGYENRMLAAQDFNDDRKDAGEIGAGHTVTALYEVIPSGVRSDVTPPPVDESRYQKQPKPTKEARSGEMLTLKIRYKEPDGDTSTKLTFLIKDEGKRFGQASQDFRFAASVASFGMLLRDSQYKGNATYAGVLEIATEAASCDNSGYRQEFLGMVSRAKELSGQ